MTVTATILSLVPYGVIRAAEAAGVDPAPLYQVRGIDPSIVPGVDAHLPIDRYFALWEQVMAKVSVPGFQRGWRRSRGSRTASCSDFWR